MTQQPALTDKRRILRADVLFTCSMLFACCILFTALIAAPFWEFEERQPLISTNTTSTALAIATQQAQYDFVDPFNTNKNRWRVGSENSEYWLGSTRIEKGIYLWDVTETKDTFISWSDFSVTEYIKDFDAYVDTKVIEGGFGDVCSGLRFRVSLVSWFEKYYYFSLCNNSTVHISYYSEADGWESIATVPYYELSDDWNRLEINARGSHFKFLINGDWVYEMDDDRLEAGSLALMIELNEKVPAKILFDNFGFQSR